MRVLRQGLRPLSSFRLCKPLGRPSPEGHWAYVVAAGAAASGMLVSHKYIRMESEVSAVPQTKTKTPSLVLAADCGGTNTRLMLYRVDPSEPIVEKQKPPGRLLKEVKYPNALFKSLEEIIRKFLIDECQCGVELDFPVVAVFAVAGVVANNSVRYTNLDWIVNGYDLQERLSIPRIEIINDFVAQGYGSLTLSDDEVIPLNDVEPVIGSPIACIGAGTGLGECFLVSDTSGNYRCYPSEGGHVEFAPRGQGNDELQISLLKHLKIKFSGWNRISIERVVSGKGICNVYEFLAYHYPDRVDYAVHKEFTKDPENAYVIAVNAKPGTLCEKAMQIFASCYGSQVGSLALHFMPYKGLYITGGVTQKSLAFLQRDSTFMDAYLDKGRVSPLLNRVPLYFVKVEDMGQRGAHYRAISLLKQHLQGIDTPVQRSQDFTAQDLPAPRTNFVNFETEKEIKALIADFATRNVSERRNRRLPLTKAMQSVEPVHEGPLYKVLKVGYRGNKDDWVRRKMWLASDGALIYYSEEEGRNLIYWTRNDLQNAVVSAVPESDSAMPHTFSVHPNAADEHIAASFFAATSDEDRDAWMAKIQELQGQYRVEQKPSVVNG